MDKTPQARQRTARARAPAQQPQQQLDSSSVVWLVAKAPRSSGSRPRRTYPGEIPQILMLGRAVAPHVHREHDVEHRFGARAARAARLRNPLAPASALVHVTNTGSRFDPLRDRRRRRRPWPARGRPSPPPLSAASSSSTATSRSARLRALGPGGGSSRATAPIRPVRRAELRVERRRRAEHPRFPKSSLARIAFLAFTDDAVGVPSAACVRAVDGLETREGRVPAAHDLERDGRAG